jgi:hypothetical protein
MSCEKHKIQGVHPLLGGAAGCDSKQMCEGGGWVGTGN